MLDRRPALDLLQDHVVAADPVAADRLLRGLSDDDRREVRKWLVGRAPRTLTERLLREDLGHPDRQHLWPTRGWLLAMGALAVCSPVEAVKTIQWPNLWDHEELVARDLALTWLDEKPAEWTAPFVDAAAALPLSKSETWHSGVTLARVVARGVVQHGLPCPTGRTFLSAYLVDQWKHPVDADRLRAEPLMPDVIHHMISAGVIANLSALHEAAPVLVREGRLDRDRLVESCLAALTVDQRTSSQRVLAKLLAALELTPDEVPGGLSFLTGVIATRDGSVGAVLLPPALALAADAAGLEELTRVVAGRKEKKQKQQLLEALRDPELMQRAGLDGVLRSLEILAEGQEDARLLKDVAAARDQLGAPVDPVESQQVRIGLWEAELDPGPPPSWTWRPASDVVAGYFLDRRKDLHAGATEQVVATFVHGLAGGQYDAENVVAMCRGLRVGGRLAVTRLVTLFEAAFLAGGLRLMWPAALAVADDLASASRTPAGLPELLRMLTRYAPEVPDGQSLPPHLAAVAARDGATVLQLESRALGAALARVAAADYQPGNSGTGPAEVRGLWELRVPTPVLALVTDSRYAHIRDVDDQNLGYLLDVNLGLGDRINSTGPRYAATRDDQALGWLAVSVQRHGLEDARERVRRTWTAKPVGAAAAALKGWVGGAIDAATYDSQHGRIWTDMDAGLPRVVFAWWCEQLTRLETHPGLLGRPDSSYGFVDPGLLLARVRHLHGIARPGPLDVVLALTRLAPERPEDPAELLAGLDGLELWTEEVGGAPSFDAVPVIRRWVEAGGLRAPELPLDVALVPGLVEADLLGPGLHPELLARVRPGDPDLPGEVRPLRHHVQMPWQVDGRITEAFWAEQLRRGLGGGHAWTQDRTLAHVAELAQHDGLLAPEVTVPVAVDRVDAGHLSLARFTESLQWLFERGALRALWPLGLGVADAVAARTPKPNGLAVLLAALATYAPEVPAAERHVPDGVRALAEGRGSTKSHAAARSVVAALEVAS